MITVVMGPPAAGKTTYIAENKNPGDIVIDFDAMASVMGAGESHDAPEPVGKVVFAARTAAIARIFEGVDADAWIIQSNLNKESIGRWAEGGAKFVVIDPGKETVLAQAEADGRPDGTVELIEAWYENPPVVPDEKGRAMRFKTVEILAKAGDGLAEGQFEGYASVFGNKDSYGDVVVKGAFTKSLETYGDGGAGIPAYWGHRMDDPDFNIGQTVSAVEDDRGLKVRVQLDLDSPKGAQVHKLIKEGRVTQMSFAYDVVDGGPAKSDELGEFFELRELTIHEVSVVPVGANQETELLAVKDLISGVKVGRKLSTKNEERLSDAHALIGDVLAELESDDSAAEELSDGNAPKGAEDLSEVKVGRSKNAVITMAEYGIY